MAHIKITIQSIEDLSVEFLSQALGAKVVDFTCERIGTGQVGECHRVKLQHATDETGPASAVIKLGASGRLSRDSGWRLGIYERESRFYSEIAPLLESKAIVKNYHTVCDREGDLFHILLEDISPATAGDDIAGATLEQAHLALRELGKLQCELLSKPLPEWVETEVKVGQAYLQQLWTGFLIRYGERVKPEHQEVVTRWLSCFDEYARKVRASTKHKCLAHGDYRLDNMLFRYDGDRPVSLSVVDWQMLTTGSVFQDVAYFIGFCIPSDIRQEHIKKLLQTYHGAFGPNPPFTLEECEEGIRELSFWGLPLAFASPMILEQTDRGDKMFLTMLDRLATYIIDLKAVDTLPNPAPSTPLAVDPSDETSHPASDHPLHNESLYFDVADTDQKIGLWIRLGVTPNQPGSWYNALICGPGRPTIAVSDFEVPHPTPDFTITSENINATHTPEIPLQQYRVTLTGKGESFPNPADLLSGKPKGTPVTVHLDLTWHTAATPYQWKIATRYEIPCTVSGTLTIDNTVTTFSSAPGQRDHSWGVRDWWAFDWVWTAFHLDDGTHIHGVQVRVPPGPVSVGYIQGPDTSITELTGVEVVEEVGGDGIPVQARIVYSVEGEKDVVLRIEIRGQAPVRLESPDGRVSLFPRAWAVVEAGDGRRGVGWVEWNFCQK
ncbi:kinase-like domain-containing protein [Aspergillus karnatakaensis]|uniref:kinase-like domain-containing protein n=1 Tax=Aspergillus karnatakaensis TaxID=1810916 RepID=UPI003CCDBDDA